MSVRVCEREFAFYVVSFLNSASLISGIIIDFKWFSN